MEVIQLLVSQRILMVGGVMEEGRILIDFMFWGWVDGWDYGLGDQGISFVSICITLKHNFYCIDISFMMKTVIPIFLPKCYLQYSTKYSKQQKYPITLSSQYPNISPLIIIIKKMHESTQNPQPSVPLQKKAKAMALKYQKYCRKTRQQLHCKISMILGRVIGNIDALAIKMWRVVVPKWISGPRTYWDMLIEKVPVEDVKLVEGLPISKLSLTQSIQKSRITLLIPIRLFSLSQTLHKLGNSEQVKSLSQHKAVILPVIVDKGNNDEVAIRMRQLVESQGRSAGGDQPMVFVVWKGLYEEIVVIAKFMLKDAYLCSKIVKAVEQREEYERMIKLFAQEELQEQANEQCTVNKISEQSTVVTSKCGSD